MSKVKVGRQSGRLKLLNFPTPTVTPHSSASLVALLRRMLEEAASGKLQGLAVAVLYDNGGVWYDYDVDGDGFHSIIAGCDLLKARIVEDMVRDLQEEMEE